MPLPSFRLSRPKVQHGGSLAGKLSAQCLVDQLFFRKFFIHRIIAHGFPPFTSAIRWRNEGRKDVQGSELKVSVRFEP
jgi:hypothetical protein